MPPAVRRVSSLITCKSDSHCPFHHVHSLDAMILDRHVHNPGTATSCQHCRFKFISANVFPTIAAAFRLTSAGLTMMEFATAKDEVRVLVWSNIFRQVSSFLFELCVMVLPLSRSGNCCFSSFLPPCLSVCLRSFCLQESVSFLGFLARNLSSRHFHCRSKLWYAQSR